MTEGPINVALLNDNELVVNGLASMLRPHRDRVRVVDVSRHSAPDQSVDIVLYDTFATDISNAHWSQFVATGWSPRYVVLYCWEPAPGGHLGQPGEEPPTLQVSKLLEGEELVAALVQISATGSYEEPVDPLSSPSARDWPGRSEGLGERESEILSLVVAGHDDDQVAARLYLDVGTVQTYLRTAYDTIGAVDRAAAVVWGIDHGFRDRPTD